MFEQNSLLTSASQAFEPIPSTKLWLFYRLQLIKFSNDLPVDISQLLRCKVKVHESFIGWKNIILPVCPSEDIQSNVDKHSPVEKSHNFIVLSRDPEIILPDSKDKLKSWTWILNSHEVKQAYNH